jgi:ribosomal subunit interface protein
MAKEENPMQIKITGKHIEVGDALRSHIEAKLQSFRERFFEGSVHGTVILEKQRGQFLCDCTLHLATGLVLQSHAQNADAMGSADAALSHLEKQLKKYKQRLKDHHRQPRDNHIAMAASYFVIDADEHEDDRELGHNPPVIAESAATVPKLSVGEAVMQLDISTSNFVLFHNSKEGRINVVYRRPDGNIGWLDPRAA